MAEIEFRDQSYEIENRLRYRYSVLSKVFLLLGFLLLVWDVVVFIGAKFLDYGYRWAFISLENWIIITTTIIVIMVFLIIIFFVHFSFVKKKLSQAKLPKIEYIDNKRVHVFTYPEGAEGGVFSKTYIEIDENNILRLRTLMIPPEELWGKK